MKPFFNNTISIYLIEKARLATAKYLVTPSILSETQIQIVTNNPHGFSFSLRLEGSESILEFGKWHQPFDDPEQALSVFEKCLSGEARLRDITSLGIPYTGILEIWKESSQEPEIKFVNGTIAVLFLFLFPKKEKIYENAFAKAS